MAKSMFTYFIIVLILAKTTGLKTTVQVLKALLRKGTRHLIELRTSKMTLLRWMTRCWMKTRRTSRRSLKMAKILTRTLTSK